MIKDFGKNNLPQKSSSFAKKLKLSHFVCLFCGIYLLECPASFPKMANNIYLSFIIFSKEAI
ncbi:hypothetical protein DMC01_05095 [Campylobacter troglodytis]|nr:hypothetical protein DMC01_05095 [Campylobacter troglodytis]